VVSIAAKERDEINRSADAKVNFMKTPLSCKNLNEKLRDNNPSIDFATALLETALSAKRNSTPDEDSMREDGYGSSPRGCLSKMPVSS
jgi:hypothetical protein